MVKRLVCRVGIARLVKRQAYVTSACKRRTGIRSAIVFPGTSLTEIATNTERSAPTRLDLLSARQASSGVRRARILHKDSLKLKLNRKLLHASSLSIRRAA
jgi:hypothetical protein